MAPPGAPWSRVGSPAGAGSASGTKGGGTGRAAARSSSQASRRPRKSSDGVRPWRRATDEIDAAVLCASLRIARFSSRVHERRVPATTIWSEIVGPDIGRIQAFATALYPTPGSYPARRLPTSAYSQGTIDEEEDDIETALERPLRLRRDAAVRVVIGASQKRSEIMGLHGRLRDATLAAVLRGFRQGARDTHRDPEQGTPADRLRPGPSDTKRPLALRTAAIAQRRARPRPDLTDRP